ncbi:hypothetical protein HYH03_009321 [Edaphochlamys debaryana]|uniref:BTB domain-containing protein n=1 Tax=Edaphochlamys debaryana TaxID=47281 RepID=A0A836BYJ3_9CHLO|nr:hypothetical protein HYH03_009321 [Edaphochlamys debaryana]|eukprot:KAG2492373.1 hypothetical protein HYH03_009321 [Edaphochlamys debaryana]
MLCVLKGTLSPLGPPAGVVARPQPGAPNGADPQVLVMTNRGAFYPLLGACGHSGLRLGSALSLLETGEAPGNPLRPYQPLEDPTYCYPTWDSWSRSIFFRAGHAIFRLTSDNVVELVAGDPREEGEPEDEDEEAEAAEAGTGPANEDARFCFPFHLVSDGKGSIYCTSVVGNGDLDAVLRLQLPAVWRAPEGEPAAAAEGGGLQRVRLSTLHIEEGRIYGGLAYSHSDGCLVMANDTALFRLPLGAGGERGPAPVLLAGRPGEEGERDGRGDRARFKGPTSSAADGNGNILVTEDRGGRLVSNTSALRRVTPDGSVATLASGLAGRFDTEPLVLPNGYLAICAETSLLVLDLGLKPLPLLPPASAAGHATSAAPPRRTLHADMGALLDAQPDGTADLTLVVASRRFLAHRAILVARCDYFKQRLARGGFADGAAAELDLPDADPAAFELLLRFVYTGAVDIPPALAPSVAELADRLLLPELCADAQAVVLSGVSAATVVGSLLWAERLGGSFSGLVSSLKAWAVEHYEEVRGSGSLRRLMAESPELMEDMMAHALTKRPRAQ